MVQPRRDPLQAEQPKGALEAFERALKHPETKEQAAREIDKLRTAKDPGPSREVSKPGSTTVQPTGPPRY